MTSDVIETFMAATANMASPPQFRLWAAISMVSCTMSRRVWTCIEDDLKLFPNTFILLVSQPGMGKSRPTDLVHKLLSKLDTVTFAGDEVTREEMIQHMGETFLDKYPEGSRSFVAAISEFSTFMPKPDLAWMQAIARLWDNPAIYVRRTKHMGQDFLHNPYLCMLAGVQPAWFAEGFPANAYELGLPARCYFVYADKKPVRSYFGTRKQAAGIDAVLAGLKQVQAMRGELVWEPAAKRAWDEWADGGMMPAPLDPLLSGYAVRRDMHTAKLTMIAAAAAHPTRLVIEEADFKRALKWLLDVEQDMPRALAAAGGNTFRLREEAVIQYVRARYAETRKTVPEYAVRQALGRLVPPQLVAPIVDELINQRRLRSIGGDAPNRLLAPPTEEKK